MTLDNTLIVLGLAVLIAIPLALVINRVAHYFKFRKILNLLNGAVERDDKGRFRKRMQLPPVRNPGPIPSQTQPNTRNPHEPLL